MGGVASTFVESSSIFGMVWGLVVDFEGTEMVLSDKSLGEIVGNPLGLHHKGKYLHVLLLLLHIASP